jgi:hypothetical protein
MLRISTAIATGVPGQSEGLGTHTRAADFGQSCGPEMLEKNAAERNNRADTPGRIAQKVVKICRAIGRF